MSWRGNIGSKLKELRIVFCQESPASLGARNFVLDNYIKVKQASPRFPFIVRECQGADPLIIARYRFGVEKKELLSDYSKEQIEELVNDLMEQSEQVNKHLHS